MNNQFGRADEPRDDDVDLSALDGDHAERMDRIARVVAEQIATLPAPRRDPSLYSWQIAFRTAAVGGALAACAAILSPRMVIPSESQDAQRNAIDAAGITGVPPFVAALLDSATVPAPDALLRIEALHDNVTQVRNTR